MNSSFIDNSLIEKICTIACRAGSAIMEIYLGDFSFEKKYDDSPLTIADRLSHEIIERDLQNLYGDIPVLSEEGKDIPYEIRKNWKYFWLIDPLDGTKEFIKRNGEFTVNIALVEYYAPVLGVVYVPAQKKLFCGVAGKQAFVQEGSGAPLPIRVRPADPDAGLRVVMSRSHPSPELDDYLKNIKIADALPVGSSLKLIAVAEGKADLYPRLGPTMEWDTAAGQAVVEAAGGSVTTLAGIPLTYNKKNLLNPYFIVKGSA